MFKGSIQKENVTVVNIYVPNIAAPQYIMQTITDMKEKLRATRVGYNN